MTRPDTPLLLWIAEEILPHERALRVWLRSAFPRHNADDVIQESYCRLAELDAFVHVGDPKRYLFQTARNVVLTDMRRARVVRIDAIGGASDLDAAIASSDDLSPERVAAGRSLLRRVETLLAALPERSRTIFRLRKLNGLSQREIARQLGLSENVVENDLARGLRIILAGLSDDDRMELRHPQRKHGHG